MDVDDENKVDKNETNDKPKAKGKGASSGKSLNLFKKQWHHVPIVPAGMLVLTLILGSIAIFYWGSLNSNETQEVDTVKLETTYPDTDVTYQQRSEQLAFGGDYDAAQQVLQDGADLAKGNNESQAEFYMRKAELAINNGRYEDSLGLGIKSDEINPTVISALIIAQSSEQLGDIETAIKYFQLAADRTPEEQRATSSDVSEYQGFVEKVEQLKAANED